MFVFAIAVYITVTIPALRAVVNPDEADSEFTLDQNLGLLGAGNTIIAGLLALILIMQARRVVSDKAANEADCFFVFRADKSTRNERKQGSWLRQRRRRRRLPSLSEHCCWALLTLVLRLLPMHSRTDLVQRLLSWCSSKRIHIDERLSVIQDEITGEVSVFNLSEGAIPVSQTCKWTDYVRDSLMF